MTMVRKDIADMLRAGVPQAHIARELGVAPATVQKNRKKLGLPAPRCGPRNTYASLDEAFRVNTEQLADGHVRWIGYTDNDRTPRVCYRQERLPAPRVAFRLRYGREPVGKPQPTCGVKGCVAGEHLADRPMREAQREAVRQANKRADIAFKKIFGGIQ